MGVEQLNFSQVHAAGLKNAVLVYFLWNSYGLDNYKNKVLKCHVNNDGKRGCGLT